MLFNVFFVHNRVGFVDNIKLQRKLYQHKSIIKSFCFSLHPFIFCLYYL